MNSTCNIRQEIHKLGTIFANFGLREQILEDNKSAFTSKKIVTLLQGNGAQQINTTPYHPASNGQFKRIVNTKKYIKQNHE